MVVIIRRPFGIVWRAVFGGLQNQYLKLLQVEVGNNCDSLLDVGCGFNSPVQSLVHRPRRLVGLDTFSPAIEQSRSSGIHNEYYSIDALDIGRWFNPNSYECVLASDLVEHLNKKDGRYLITQMEMIAKKRLLFIHPTDFLNKAHYTTIRVRSIYLAGPQRR